MTNRALFQARTGGIKIERSIAEKSCLENRAPDPEIRRAKRGRQLIGLMRPGLRQMINFYQSDAYRGIFAPDDRSVVSSDEVREDRGFTIIFRPET